MAITFSADKQRVRPLPSDPWEASRIDETSRRRRILEGRWESDYDQWRVAELGPTRDTLMGARDLSRNFLLSFTGQLASLYDVRPTVTHPAGEFLLLIGADLPNGKRDRGLLESGGLWAIMPRTQQFTLGLNEMIMSPEVRIIDGIPKVTFRPVFPDMIVADADPDDPSRPVRVQELRDRPDPRAVGGEAWIWTWYKWDLTDLDHPVFAIWACDNKGEPCENITHLIFGELDGDPQGFTGAGYPWRWASGRPYYPGVVYHRTWPATLWDPWAKREAVDGTLKLAVLWSYWAYTVKIGAHAQKYIGGGEIETEVVQTTDQGGLRHAVSDPGAVLRIRQDETATNLIIGQWGPAVDPLVLGQAIGAYEAGLAENLGVRPGDLVRTSGDPRSGYALAVSREGELEERKRHAPIMQPSDELLIAMTAAAVNRAVGADAFPEAGWVVEYDLQQSALPTEAGPSNAPAPPQTESSEDP